MNATPDGQDLKPTLWRTCRVLANRRRLQIFKFLLGREAATVTDVAEGIDLGLSIASMYLRALNARGLLAAARVGPFVLYRIRPNPSVVGADRIVTALRYAFERDDQSIDAVFRDLTAFTHPRRIAIVHCLRPRRAMHHIELRRLCGISLRAMERHLDKLEKRGLVTRDDDLVKYRRPASRLAKHLVDLACDTGTG